MAIEALIFDLDNTLIDRNQSIVPMHRWLTEQYLPPEKREEALKRLKQWDYFGYLSHESVLKNFIKTYGVDLNIKEITSIIRENQGHHATLIEDAIETLTALKSKYRLALLTNGSSIGQRLKIATALGHHQSLFETIIISGDLGIHKPDHQIYRAMCKALNLSPHHCVSIGDDLMNDIMNPMKLGMKAIRMNHCNLEPTTLTYEITKLKELIDFDFDKL